MSNQCVRPHEPWTWIPSSGNTGRLQVERDPKGTWKWRQSSELTFSGDSFGTEPKGYNNGTWEMCRSNWKRSFGSVTKAQWLQERTVVRESLILAWTLSAVPAWVWQMQQINPYLPPFGIKQNNASKCCPGILAVIVTFVEKKKNALERPSVCIVSRSASQI